MLKSLDDAGHTSWATGIKQMLVKLGLGFVWISQNVGDINSCISVFKQLLYNIL